MWSLKVIHNVSKVIVKIILEVREYMIHERIPYMKSNSGVYVLGNVSVEVVKL